MKPALARAALFCVLLSSAGAEIQSSLKPGAYALDQQVFFSSSVPDAKIFYRFDGGRSLHPLDAALLLSALPGEARSYSLAVEARGPYGLLESAAFSFTIDKRPPEAPTADPAPAQVLPGTKVALSSAGAAKISYALYPLSGSAQDYSGPILLPGNDRGTARYVLTAVAMDELGNASKPASFDYLCVPAGLAAAKESLAAASQAEQGQAISLQEAPSSSAETVPGGVRVSFSHKNALSFEYRVSGQGSEYASLAAKEGKASFLAAAPDSWSGSIPIEWRAILDQASNFVNGQTFKLVFQDAAESPDQTPPAARLLKASEGRGAWFIADDSQGAIRFQANGSPAEDYAAPVFIPAQEGRDSVRVQYYLARPDGGRSRDAELSLSVPPDPGRPLVSGYPEKGVSANEVSLTPAQGSVVLRYEAAAGGNDPGPVTASSPLLQPGTPFGAGEGKTVVHSVRVRSFSSSTREARGGDEAVYRFAVDRTPPEPPAIKELPGFEGYADKRFGFEPGDDEIYVQVSRNGISEGGYQRYAGPLVLKADESGPVTYAIKAYAVDRAGNRGAESKRDNVTIDATSVYVSQSGSDAQDGSPTAPVASLETALRIAAVTNRARIRVRGSVKASGDLSVSGDMAIEGGLGEDWRQSGQGESLIPLRSLTVRRGNLSLTDIAVAAVQTALDPAVVLEDGGLSLLRAKLSVDTRGDEGLRMGKGSTLEAYDSELSFKGRTTFSAIAAEDAKISLKRSTLQASGSLVSTAVSATGGSVQVEGSTLRCEAVQSAAVLALNETTYALTRSLVEAKASAGFVSCVMERNSSGSIDTCVVRSTGSAETVLFDCAGGYLKFFHVTATVEGAVRAAYGMRLRDLSLQAGNTVFASLPGKAAGAMFDGSVDAKGLSSFCVAGFAKLERNGSSEALAAKVIAADPESLFQVDAKGMPRLKAGSPLMDRGMAASGEALDWYGNPRPSRNGKGLPDIGAFEY